MRFRGDRRLALCRTDLIEIPHHVARCEEPGDRGSLMIIDDQPAVITDFRTGKRCRLALEADTRRRIDGAEPKRLVPPVRVKKTERRREMLSS